MAIASLRYDASSGVQETKGGVFVYDGDAARFHECEFRTSMRARSSKEEDMARTANSIVESLRGEAAQVAMDIGDEKLVKKDGLKTRRLSSRRCVTTCSHKLVQKRKSCIGWDTKLKVSWPGNNQRACRTM